MQPVSFSSKKMKIFFEYKCPNLTDLSVFTDNLLIASGLTKGRVYLKDSVPKDKMPQLSSLKFFFQIRGDWCRYDASNLALGTSEDNPDEISYLTFQIDEELKSKFDRDLLLARW